MTVRGARPCLWFDREAEEASQFYVSIFPNSRILSTSYFPANAHRPEGQVLLVEFEIFGQGFIALNGGPEFPHTEAVSFEITCDTQEEIDSIWNTLVSDGGRESMCGWCKDKFGVNWQVTPRSLGDYYKSTSVETTQRVNQALMSMRKIDIATIEEAAANKA